MKFMNFGHKRLKIWQKRLVLIAPLQFNTPRYSLMPSRCKNSCPVVFTCSPLQYFRVPFNGSIINATGRQYL